MIRTLAAALATSTCIVALATPAAAQTREYNIPAGSLKAALDAYVRQSGRQVVYRADEVRPARSPGVRGLHSTDAALAALLAGSGFTTRIDGELIAIVKAGNGDTASPAVSTGKAGTVSSSAGGEDTDAPGTDEIIVTAQKRDERLLDVPVPVAILPGQELASVGQTRLEDYYARIPGLGLTLSANEGEPVLVIRGVIANPSNPTVGVVVDELSYGRSIALGLFSSYPDIDPGDIARVEVLRGPQGTLYGASSIGGLIKYVTVDPSTEKAGGRIQLGTSRVKFGSDWGRDLRGALNLPVGETLAVRLSGFTNFEPGYVDNTETGEKDTDSRRSQGARFAALWRPNSDLSVRLSALLQSSKKNSTSEFVPELDNLARPYLANTGLYRRRSQAYSASLNFSLGSADVVSVTGYNIDDVLGEVDYTRLGGARAIRFFGVPRSKNVTTDNTKKFTHETRISLPIGDTIRWLVGGYYTDERSRGGVRILAASDDGTTVGLIQDNLSPVKFRELAGFTNVTFQISDPFDIQLGGRLSRQNIDFERFTVPAGSNPLDREPTFLSSDSSSGNAFTYLITPRLKVSPDMMIYGRIASGYRPGGPNFNCGVLPTVPCSFDEDTTVNYELGAKGRLFERRLTVDASVYKIDWKDIQISGLLAPNPGSSALVSYTDNASRAVSKGVELSLSFAPWHGASVTAWGAYNDAELRDDFLSFGRLIGQSGDRLPFSSQESGSATFAQEVPVAQALIGRFAGTVSYVGERLGIFRSTSTPRAVFPAYAQVDLQAELAGGDWSAKVFVNNVADSRGMLRGGVDGVSGNTNSIRPRTVGLTLAKSF